jgi:hypothetical protein
MSLKDDDENSNKILTQNVNTTLNDPSIGDYNDDVSFKTKTPDLNSNPKTPQLSQIIVLTPPNSIELVDYKSDVELTQINDESNTSTSKSKSSSKKSAKTQLNSTQNVPLHNLNEIKILTQSTGTTSKNNKDKKSSKKAKKSHKKSKKERKGSLNLSDSSSRIHSSINNPRSNNNNSNLDQVSVDRLSDITVNTCHEVITRDPIVLRGSGNITIFGVSNKFDDQFPTQLNSKLAPEEFRDTINQINSILSKELENSLKWLVFGSLFCCCTLGFSFLPVIYLNKKARLSINKFLEMENQRIYLKLGLKWKLCKIKCGNTSSLQEFVVQIDFLPAISLYHPD